MRFHAFGALLAVVFGNATSLSSIAAFRELGLSRLHRLVSIVLPVLAAIALAMLAVARGRSTEIVVPDGVRARRRRGTSWTRSSTSFAPVAAGGCCRTTCRHGRRSTTICAAGSAKGSGTGSIMRWSWSTASASVARPLRARRSSTANRCAPPIKRGLEGLRRGQEDQRTQAPHPDRYRRTPPRRASPWRRHPGSRGR